MINKKQMIDPEKTMFANLARLTRQDLEINKLKNVNLRCTNESYIVGELGTNKDGVLTFLDIMQDESFGYLYFNTVSDAERTLRPNCQDEPFVIYARPLTELGITKPCTKEELKNKLLKKGFYFNFSYLEPEKTMFANLAEFTKKDFEFNEGNKSRVRCTNKSYVVGQIAENENGNVVFFDLISKDPAQYLYFRSVRDAYYALKGFDSKKTFVVDARPLTSIGITKLYTAPELKEQLVNSEFYFNFCDEDDMKKGTTKIKK